MNSTVLRKMLEHFDRSHLILHTHITIVRAIKLLCKLAYY